MHTPAPELIGSGGWVGTDRPLSMRALLGKVVLLHFWASSCAKGQRMLDELHHLEQRFPDEVVAVSVHSPKFPYTGRHDAVVRAMGRVGIDHPVLDDPDLVTWQQYGVGGWPTVVVVDPRGSVVGAVTGSDGGPLLHQVVVEQVELHRRTTRVQRHRLAFVPPPVGPPRPPGELCFPSKVATDRHGRIAIADTGNDRVVVAALLGGHRARITHIVTGLRRPHGVRLYRSDLLVCDTGNDRVVHLDLSRRPDPTEDVPPDPGGIIRLAVRADEVIADELASPWDVIADADRSFVVAEAAGQRLWRIPADGSAPGVIAGDGYEGLVDGPAARAELAQPSGLSWLPNGIAFVDAESSALRLLQPRGRVGTLVGIGLFDWGDRDGRGHAARMQHPEGVAAALDGRSLYVADTYNHRLRWWVDGRLETLPVDGLLEPSGLDVLPDGRLLVADRGHHRICLVDPRDATLTPLQLTRSEMMPVETSDWGPRLVAVAGDELTVPFTVDLGRFALDLSRAAPVRVTVHAEPAGLLEPASSSWLHTSTEGALGLRAGPAAGSGVLTITVEAHMGAEGVTGRRRATTRRRLTVQERP